MVVEVKVFSSCQKLPLPNNNSRALAALWRRACRAALELGIPSPARIQPLQCGITLISAFSMLKKVTKVGPVWVKVLKWCRFLGFQ